MNNGQGRNEGFSEIYREVKTLAPPSPLLGWIKKIFYFILFYLTISTTYKTTYLTYYDKPDNFRQFVVQVLLLNGRLDFNRGIMEFQPLFPFSFFLGSVFYENKVSLLNKFEGVFAQRHSFMKATYRRYA